MDRKQVEWIWEYVLKHSSNRRLMRYLMEAFPIPDDNLRLKKMVLLSSLSHEVSRGLCSDLCLKLLHGMAELSKSETTASEVSEGIEADQTGGLTSEGCLPEKEEKTSRGLGQEVVNENEKQILNEIFNGTKLDHRDENGSCKSMVERDEVISKDKISQISSKDRIEALGRELDLALKVELTVQHLRDGAEGWPAFLEALDKYWDISVHGEEEVDNEDEEINIARQQIKLELWAIKARPKLQSEVICKYTREAVEKMLKGFLDLAWEEIGPTFLEKVEEDVVKGAYKPAGGVKLLQCTGKPLYQEDRASKKKVRREKPCMEMGIDVANVGIVSQECPKVSFQVSNNVEGSRNAKHVEQDDNTGREKIHELQEKLLQKTSLIANEENPAIIEQGCNNKVENRLLSRCLQGLPLKMLKNLVTTCTSNAIVQEHGLEEGLAKVSSEDDVCIVRNEQHEVMSRLDSVGKIGSESKDGETSIGSSKIRLLQQGEAMQRKEDTGASEGKYYVNHRINEANKDSKQPCTATPTETNGNQSKNAGESLNLASPPVANFDSLQRVDVEEAQAKGETNEQISMNHYAEKGISLRISKVPSIEQLADLPNKESSCLTPPPWTRLQSKPVPSLMRGSVEKRRLFRKGIVDERLIILATEKGHREGSKTLADPEISKAQEALKDSQLSLRSLVKDPLPTAMQIADEAREYIKKSVQSSPAPAQKPVNLPEKDAAPSFEIGQTLQKSQPQQEGNSNAIFKPEAINLPKASLIDRNASARTMEWEDEDEIEDNEADSPPYTSKRVRLSEFKSRKVSSLKQSSSTTYQSHRRKPRKWLEAEENVLRAGVARHGKGRWKLILQAHLDVFQDRTEVDLKDKWRNIEKSEGILRDD